jgi:hypothetical protein
MNKKQTKATILYTTLDGRCLRARCETLWRTSCEVGTGVRLCALLRTAGGCYVMHTYSQWDDGTGRCVGDRYIEATAEDAPMLLRAGCDEAVLADLIPDEPYNNL